MLVHQYAYEDGGVVVLSFFRAKGFSDLPGEQPKQTFTNRAHESRRGMRAVEFDAFQKALHKAELALGAEFRKLLGDKEPRVPAGASS